MTVSSDFVHISSYCDFLEINSHITCSYKCKGVKTYLTGGRLTTVCSEIECTKKAEFILSLLQCSPLNGESRPRNSQPGLSYNKLLFLAHSAKTPIIKAHWKAVTRSINCVDKRQEMTKGLCDRYN